MRGRTLFRLARPVFLAVSALLHLLPSGFAACLLVLLRHIPTRLGIALRYPLLRRICAECGECVAVFEGAYLHGLKNARFGDNISIHPLCYIDATGGLSIGSNVSIAHNSTIMTSEHDFSQENIAIRDAPFLMEPVVVGNNVWIGAGVRILAGVTIGDDVVIGAGSVVTKDIASGTVVVGVPARPLKSIQQDTTDRGSENIS